MTSKDNLKWKPLSLIPLEGVDNRMDVEENWDEIVSFVSKELSEEIMRAKTATSTGL